MKGVLILKPDFFTKDNFKKLIEIIKREKLAYVGAYLIHNYHKFCKSYREFDIANAIENKEERIAELQKTKYATYAYQQIFTGTKNKGVAIILEENGEEFYEKLFKAKKDMRSFIKANRKVVYYVDISKNPWSVYKHLKADMADKSYIEQNCVKLAYLNGVHLEDLEMYEKQICFEYLKTYGILSKENKIKLNQLKGMCNGKENIRGKE